VIKFNDRSKLGEGNADFVTRAGRAHRVIINILANIGWIPRRLQAKVGRCACLATIRDLRRHKNSYGWWSRRGRRGTCPPETIARNFFFVLFDQGFWVWREVKEYFFWLSLIRRGRMVASVRLRWCTWHEQPYSHFTACRTLFTLFCNEVDEGIDGPENLSHDHI